MRKAPPPTLEQHRIWDGKWGSPPGVIHGAFMIRDLLILSSGSDRYYGWEHVSVSAADRVPTWEEMCNVKRIFWEDHETVVQYHPAEKDYVNHHPNCLHLWRPLRKTLPTPPTILVGPKGDTA